MTVDGFSTFAVCLEYLPPGNAPAWDAGCARFYFALLSGVPDSDVSLLMQAVGKSYKFRPSPSEVLELWQKVTRPAPMLAEEVAGRMLQKREKKGIYQRKIPNDPYCRWETCEPPWADPLEARISAGMGGWTALCEDASPLGVLRAQIIKLASAIMAGADDTVIGTLRLEYQAANPPAPRLETLRIADPKPAEFAEFGRAEAEVVMQNLSQRAPLCIRTMPSGSYAGQSVPAEKDLATA